MHGESASRRREILARFIAAPPISAAHLWCAPIRGRPERDVRDDCFRGLVAVVLEMGARSIVVESCPQDRQDERIIASLAQVGAIGRVQPL